MYPITTHRQPYIVDVSLFRIGSFVILCVPGEFTTMAGRRLKAAVRDAVGFCGWGFLKLSSTVCGCLLLLWVVFCYNA